MERKDTVRIIIVQRKGLNKRNPSQHVIVNGDNEILSYYPTLGQVKRYIAANGLFEPAPPIRQ